MLSTLLISGLLTGSIYALMALALSLTYRSSEITNFAQGDMATLSVYVALLMLTKGQFPLLLALVLSLVLAFAMGWLSERLMRRVPPEQHLQSVILSLGLQLLVFGFIGWYWGPEQQSLPLFANEQIVRLGRWQLNQRDLLSLGIAISLMLLLSLGLHYSRWGLALQASQQNPTAARLRGIAIGQMRGLAFGISGLIGAVAALLISPIVSLDPAMMWEPLLKGFAAAVLGGMRSLKGALAGGLLLGVGESLFGFYVSLPYKSVLALLLIVGVLWLRPRGLGERSAVSKL